MKTTNSEPQPSRDPKPMVLIMAGGTGGHVFPGLAVAAKLKAWGYRVTWLGSAQGLERQWVPAADIPIFYLTIKGLRGSGWKRLLAAPWVVLRAVYQAYKIIQREQPAVVLGMGGFVTGPGGVAARLLAKPLIIHEQNAVPGLTNRLLARLCARYVLVAFPHALQQLKTRRIAEQAIVGNPLRADICPKTQTAVEGRPIRLLVLGGSLGAQRLNHSVPVAVAKLLANEQLELWHQTGERHYAESCERYQQLGLQAKVVPFIDDMNTAYQWADLVIARAGALTVSEIAKVAVASILIPYPFAVDDHQSLNARYLVDANAALMLDDKQCTAKTLALLIQSLCNHPDRLLRMARACETLPKRMATDKVAEICTQLMVE